MRLSAEEQRLVEQAQPMVRALARLVRRRFPEIPLEDFVSTGAEEAARVAPLYDPSLGVPFDVFAFKRVRGNMLRKTPAEAFGKLHIVIKRALSADVEPPPSELTLDEALEDSPEKARARAVAWAKKQAAGMLVAALHARTEEATPEAPSTAREKTQTGAVLSRALSGLDDDEQYFVKRYYHDEQPFEVIAGELGVVKRTVTRMHDRIKEKLAERLKRDGLTEAR